jgi:hypothetical protein
MVVMVMRDYDAVNVAEFKTHFLQVEDQRVWIIAYVKQDSLACVYQHRKTFSRNKSSFSVVVRKAR